MELSTFTKFKVSGQDFEVVVELVSRRNKCNSCQMRTNQLSQLDMEHTVLSCTLICEATLLTRI